MKKCSLCHGEEQIVFRVGKCRRRTVDCPVCCWDKLMPSQKIKYRHIKEQYNTAWQLVRPAVFEDKL